MTLSEKLIIKIYEEREKSRAEYEKTDFMDRGYVAGKLKFLEDLIKIINKYDKKEEEE